MDSPSSVRAVNNDGSINNATSTAVPNESSLVGLLRGTLPLIGKIVMDDQKEYPSVRILNEDEEREARETARRAPVSSMMVDVIITIIELRRKSNKWSDFERDANMRPGVERNRHVNEAFERWYLENPRCNSVPSPAPAPVQVRRELSINEAPTPEVKMASWGRADYIDNNIVTNLYDLQSDTLFGKNRIDQKSFNEFNLQRSHLRSGSLPSPGSCNRRAVCSPSSFVSIRSSNAVPAASENASSSHLLGHRETCRGEDGDGARDGVRSYSSPRAMGSGTIRPEQKRVDESVPVGTNEARYPRSNDPVCDAQVRTVQDGCVRRYSSDDTSDASSTHRRRWCRN